MRATDPSRSPLVVVTAEAGLPSYYEDWLEVIPARALSISWPIFEKRLCIVLLPADEPLVPFAELGGGPLGGCPDICAVCE